MLVLALEFAVAAVVERRAYGAFQRLLKRVLNRLHERFAFSTVTDLTAVGRVAR